MTTQATAALVSEETHSCQHTPQCPSATDENYLAAKIAAPFPEMDCVVLCNGRYAFGDEIRAAAPHKPLVRVELQASLRVSPRSRLHALGLLLICWLSRRRGPAPSPIVRGDSPLAARRRAIGASGAKLTIEELQRPSLTPRAGFPMPNAA